MFAIVQFKKLKLVKIIPCSWIFGFNVDDINLKQSYNAFWSTDSTVEYTTINWKTPEKNPTTLLSDNRTYKVYVQSVHSKFF